MYPVGSWERSNSSGVSPVFFMTAVLYTGHPGTVAGNTRFLVSNVSFGMKASTPGAKVWPEACTVMHHGGWTVFASTC